MSLITLAIQDIPEVILVTDQPDLALVSRAAALLIEKNLHIIQFVSRQKT